METKSATCGRKGEGVRSDCFVKIEKISGNSTELDISSKVERLYGDKIREDVLQILNFYNLEGIKLTLQDFGALPFVLFARIECAIKRLFPEIKRDFLPPLNKEVKTKCIRERFRRSRLYLPGNEPKFMINAGIHKPDGIILDLEDSVSPDEKDAARILVRNALRSINFYESEKMVRINQLPMGLGDLEEIVPQPVELILIPKCETEEDVINVDKKISELEEKSGRKEKILLMPIIESAKGIMNAYKIAGASKRNVALTIGLEDYTADIGAERTEEGRESFYARSVIVNAAKSFHLQAIDTVYSDVSNMEGLKKATLEAKSLGFEGKGCIHPRQIKVIHEAFKPTEKEVEKAMKIAKAIEEAKKRGSGVISIGSKMVDPPVVKRAERILKLAKEMGLIQEEKND